MSDLPATIGAKFAVVRRLGKGGMGTVFEAIDQSTGERVAVKVIAANMADDPSLVSRFQREVRTVSSLSTPHIVKVIDAGVDPPTQLPYMAMEHLEGEDLRQLLKRLGPLPSSVALRITAQACKALDAAHRARILHRDIKPANLFLHKSGGKRIVKLLDFGVAKVEKGALTGDAEMTGLTRTGSMIGSPLYMSPEQARGFADLDGRSDLWSLGVCLYQMLCGRTPHAKIEQLGELLVRICTIPPPPIQRRAPWVAPSVAGLLAHLLAMDAKDRFADAPAVLDAIEVLLSGDDSIEEEALRPLSDAERAIAAETTAQHDAVPTVAQGMGRSGMNRSGMNVSQSAPAVFASPHSQGEQEAQAESPTGTGRVEGGRSSTLTAGAASMTGGTVAPVPAAKPWRLAAIGLTAGMAAAVVYFGLLQKPAAPSGQAAPQGAAQADTRPRAVKLFVLPKDAAVEIGGAPAEVADGLVEIAGPLGSVHKVRVTAGGVSKLVEIAITENGPVPPKIEIDVPPAAAVSSAAPSAPAASTPTLAPHPVVAQGAPVKPKPSATSAPAATPTGRTLRDDR